MVRLTWEEFKQLLDRGLAFQYVTGEEGDVLYSQDGSITFQSFVKTDNSDYTTTYKPLAKPKLAQLDAEGAETQRLKVARPGSAYLMLPIEIETSTLSGLVAEDYSGNTRNFIVHKFYDTNNVEITDPQNENSIVKLVLDIEAPYDIEVIGGFVHQGTRPSSPLRVFSIIAPDIPTNYGGSIEMVGGVNLQFIDSVKVDGRAAKPLKYSSQYHSNKIRFIFKHSAGLKHKLMITLEYFR